MKTLRLNKNANWYTARFTDITVSEERGVVVLENNFTSEKYIIEDKKFATKISMYLYEKNGKFHWFEMNDRIEKWVNNRKFSKKYDNVENR